MFSDQLNKALAVFTLRQLLGFILLMQGIGKVFQMGVQQVYEGYFIAGMKLNETFLPEWVLQFTAYFTSYAELICGFLLIIGLLRDYALATMALVLIIVSFGHGLVEPIWSLEHVFFRGALLVAIWLLPRKWDTLRLDAFIFNLNK